MKLLHMHADDFGGLHQYDYDFEEGLNVVLHDNGWGKTTMAAFLKAMLYGFDTKRSKDITENERKRYRPWQGGKYGGYLDFEAEGKKYRVYRTFGETPRFDTAKIKDLEKNTTARIDPKKIGETLFKLDASAFQRSVFINQNGLSIDGAASSIHTRLNALVSQANDVAAFDDAIASLTAQIKVYEKTGARGQLGDITRQISVLEHQRRLLDSDIAEQDNARNRIAQIDVLLTVIDKDLKEKKEKLDKVSGETKKQEATKKLIEDLDQQIASLNRQLDDIKAQLGGSVPSTVEIEQTKNRKQSAVSLKQQLTELEQSCAELRADYRDLLEKYGGELPTAKQLDKIQGIYGELQGIRAADVKSEVTADNESEVYSLIKAASEENPNYISRLQIIVGNQVTVQNLIRELEVAEDAIQHERESWKEKKERFNVLSDEVIALRKETDDQKAYTPEKTKPVTTGLELLQKRQRTLTRKLSEQDSEIKQEAESWEEKKRRYASRLEETERLQREVDSRNRFAPNKVKPIIATLEELQKQQQLVDVKKAELASEALTSDEESLLADNSGELPDITECNGILRKLRNVSQKTSDVQGLEARKGGEQSKESSLRVSLEQLNAVPDDAGIVFEEPKKPFGTAMIGVGAAVAVIGIILIFIVTPIMAAVAAAGALLAVLGIVGNNNYKKKQQAFEAYKAASIQREENRKKKEDLQKQIDAAKATIDTLQKQIDSLNSEISKDQNSIDAWGTKWMPGKSVSEASVSEIIEKTEKITRLRKKQLAFAEKTTFVNEKSEYITSERKRVTALFPEVSGKSISDALSFIRSGETEYTRFSEQLKAARKNTEKFLAESNVTAEKLRSEESPRLTEMRLNRNHIASELEGIGTERKVYDDQYPEIAGLSYEDAIKFLREKTGKYQVLDAQLQAATRNLQKFIKDSKISEKQFAADESPRINELVDSRDKASQNLSRTINEANEVLAALKINTDQAHIIQTLREAERMLNEYQQYDAKVKDNVARQQKKQQQIDELQNELSLAFVPLGERYADKEIPERISLARKEIAQATALQAKIVDSEREQKKLADRISAYESAVAAFVQRYGKFAPETDDVLLEIAAKTSSCAELSAAVRQLEKQKLKASSDQQASRTQSHEQETELKEEISRLEQRRDALRDEYTHKSDLIRQADQSLEKYPDVTQEIHNLYEQKQKAQNTVSMLKRTIFLITKAKESLADRYLSKVEQLFNSYMQIWLNNDTVKGILDVNFNITIEENDKVHVAEGYSTGYCDLIDFCMRLALIDTLFENEPPFLILDDPFVNLDADRLDKALELLNALAANKQIVYFVCHPIRAVESNANSSSREAFVTLAEATKRTIESRKSAKVEHKKSFIRKSPREMYKVVEGKELVIKPAKPDYTITNNIFSMNFVLKDAVIIRNHSYELFFIDANGHVLNDRQLIEIKDGKLSTERVRFCLNTRDDSGDQYELMIREIGQEDYEVIARIPFRAKLAFAGTFSFDF